MTPSQTPPDDDACDLAFKAQLALLQGDARTTNWPVSAPPGHPDCELGQRLPPPSLARHKTLFNK